MVTAANKELAAAVRRRLAPMRRRRQRMRTRPDRAERNIQPDLTIIRRDTSLLRATFPLERIFAEGGGDHARLSLFIASNCHRFIRLAHRAQDGKSLIDMIMPNPVDLLSG